MAQKLFFCEMVLILIHFIIIEKVECQEQDCVDSTDCTDYETCHKGVCELQGGNADCNRSNWSYFYGPSFSCCSNDNPCGAGEGDCDYDSECADDLTCGAKSCYGWGHLGYDCCEKAPPRAITSKNCAIGVQVKRGRDWEFGMKDYHNGREGNGVITNCSHELEVFVDWDNENSDIFPLSSTEGRDVYFLTGTGRVCETTNLTEVSKDGIPYTIPMPNNQCVFPFSHRNKTHYACITGDIFTNASENENYWCGTDYHVTNTTNWGICNNVCPRENKPQYCLIYKTGLSSTAGSNNVVHIEVVSLTNQKKLFILDEPKVKGEEKKVCLNETHFGFSGIKTAKIKQEYHFRSENSWSLRRLAIQNSIESPSASPQYIKYSLDAGNERFMVDGDNDCENNDDHLLCCKGGEWCELKEIGGDGYTPIDHSFCNTSNVYNPHGSLSKAKLACSRDEKCIAIYQVKVDERISFNLCSDTFITASSYNSYVYKKKENQVFANDFLHSNEAYQLEINNTDVMKEFTDDSPIQTVENDTSRHNCEEYCSKEDKCLGCVLDHGKFRQWKAMARDGLEHVLAGEISSKPVCVDIKVSGASNGCKWSFGQCSGDYPYHKRKQYTHRCCLKPNNYTLYCEDHEGDGWRSGTIEIQGHYFCDDLVGFKTIQNIEISESPKNINSFPSKNLDSNDTDTGIDCGNTEIECSYPCRWEASRSVCYKQFLDPGDGAQGTWFPPYMETCPPSSYVNEFYVNIAPYDATLQNDQKGLDSIKVVCTDKYGRKTKTLTPHLGQWGKGEAMPMSCGKHFINGIEVEMGKVKVGSYSGLYNFWDSVGISNIRAFCTNETTLEKNIESEYRGQWQGRKNCDANMAVCGLQLRIQTDEGGDPLMIMLGADDSGLNGARFQCCPLPPTGKSELDLTPRIPTGGCPPGTRHRMTVSFRTCNCEDHCSWDRCRLDKAPENCLVGTEAKWTWNKRRKFWVAKVVQPPYALIAGCKYGEPCADGEGKRCLSTTKCSKCSFGECIQKAKAANAAGFAFTDSGSCKLCSSWQLNELVSDNGWGVYSQNGTLPIETSKVSTVPPITTLSKRRIKITPRADYEEVKLEDIDHGMRITQIVVYTVLLSLFAMYLLHAIKRKSDRQQVLLECVEIGFTVVCSILAAHMTMEQISRFLENKDTSSISYKRFNHLPTDKYPTFSICFEGSDLLWNDDLIFKHYGISPRNFERILKGDKAVKYHYNRHTRLYTKVLIDANHINVTDPNRFHRPASEFLSGLEFRTEDPAESIRYGNGKLGNQIKEIPFYIGYQTPEIVCFTRLSDEGLNSIRMLDRLSFVPSVFGNKIYSYVEMKIFVHYPGQLMRSFHKPIVKTTVGGTRVMDANTVAENFWDKILRIRLSEITVLRKRPDANRPCNEELEDDDLKLQQEIIRRLDCIPAYWNRTILRNRQLEYCFTPSQYQNVSRYLQDYPDILMSYRPPCIDMSVLALYEGVEPKHGNDPQMEIMYPEKIYQEIRNTKSFGFEGFVSGVGGFVGIFLGYSLLQLPSLLQSALSFYRQCSSNVFRSDEEGKSSDGKLRYEIEKAINEHIRKLDLRKLQNITSKIPIEGKIPKTLKTGPSDESGSLN